MPSFFAPPGPTHFVDAGVAERPSDTLASVDGAEAFRRAAFNRCSGSTMRRGMNLLKVK